MRKIEDFYSHFEFAEPQGEAAEARLQFLCDLINSPPVWVNKEGVETFLKLVRMMRAGTVPELAVTDEIGALYYDGKWHVGLSSVVPAAMSAQDTMKWLYTYWITNPMSDRFDGPCPGRRNGQDCGKYYFRRGRNPASQKYCNRRTCGKDTAAANVYKNTRKQKLDAAREAVGKWKPSSEWPDWKLFVIRNSKILGITRNFLTHAVKEKDLEPPKGAK